jgi:K+-sensing histidine kinase KdpD
MPSLPEKAPLLKDDMPAYLYVAVTDTGPGLTPKELDMLFQRFSQVSRMTCSLDLPFDIALMG